MAQTTTQGGAVPEYVAPTTDAERALADIWVTVLGLERIGVHDDFLDLGGDSILAMRIIARIRSVLDCDLPLIEFLDRPTIAEQAALVEGGVVT